MTALPALPDVIAAGQLEISNSEIQVAQLCPRRWALTYHWRWQIRPEATAPTSKAAMGTAVHLALEAWYGHGVDPLAALHWHYESLAAEHPAWVEPLAREHELARVMVEGFAAWLEESGVDSQLDVVDVERDLRVPLEVQPGVRVTLRARLDQVVRSRVSGAYLVRDWKTVDSLAKANSLTLNQQMRFYALLLSLLYRDRGIVANGALYVMLKRSKRTLRATPPFYSQVEILYGSADLNSTWLRVREVTRRIVAWHTRLAAGADHHEVAYPNATDACDWACPFRHVCPLLDDGSRWEDALAASFTQADPYRYYARNRITELVEALT